MSSRQPTQYAHLVSCHIHLSHKSSAAEHVRLLLELDPEFTVSRFGRSLHYKIQEDKDHLLNALIEAGVPA